VYVQEGRHGWAKVIAAADHDQPAGVPASRHHTLQAQLAKVESINGAAQSAPAWSFVVFVSTGLPSPSSAESVAIEFTLLKGSSDVELLYAQYP
jgi:hypothetical protein